MQFKRVRRKKNGNGIDIDLCFGALAYFVPYITGDELYIRESRSEVIIKYHDDLKGQLKDIAHMMLQKFHFYEPKHTADDISNMVEENEIFEENSDSESVS